VDGSGDATVDRDTASDVRATEGGDGATNDGDTRCPDEGAATFPDSFRDSVWLIGWSGGLNHFSWVKFNFLSPTGLNGTASVMNAAGVGTTPYFRCEGNGGLFSVDPAARQIVLQTTAIVRGRRRRGRAAIGGLLRFPSLGAWLIARCVDDEQRTVTRGVSLPQRSLRPQLHVVPALSVISMRGKRQPADGFGDLSNLPS
jgi:hypothetical protein